jgi:hypothetical protein
MKIIRTLAAALLLAAPLSLSAADLACNEASNVEEFRYAWRLKGGLRWVAGIMFPTSGVANLKTVYPTTGSPEGISSELLITSPTGRKDGGYYQYESRMDDDGGKTMMTFHGYAWGEKSRLERTTFDYVKNLARIRKQTPEKVENKVKQIPDEELRDILTAIYFMRQNAPAIRAAMHTSIYSDGKEYPVVIKPAERKVFEFSGKRVNALGFEIVDAPGGKKWPGGIKLWLSDDTRRVPVRIEIRQSFASMQLDLQSESCAFMAAAK